MSLKAFEWHKPFGKGRVFLPDVNCSSLSGPYGKTKKVKKILLQIRCYATRKIAETLNILKYVDKTHFIIFSKNVE